MCLPSDTKVLLTKNYSKIIIFEKLRIPYVIPWKSLSFQEISRAQDPSKITKNNSQGIIFVIISCQRVFQKRKPHRRRGQGLGSVDLRFATGWPSSMPENLDL